MSKKEYVVRVVTYTDNEIPLAFLECLSYAGYVKVHNTDREKGETFDILCRHTGILSDVWAEQNAARMQTFGFNAVKAPKWGT